jgi:hypothetical protein
MDRGTRGLNGVVDVTPMHSRPCSPRARAPRRVLCSFQLIQHGARIVKQRAAGVGQLHATGLAAKQLNVELALQRFQLKAEGRLLDAEPLGGARDMAFLCDGNEIAQMPELHRHNPKSINFDCPILWLPECGTASLMKTSDDRRRVFHQGDCSCCAGNFCNSPELPWHRRW